MSQFPPTPYTPADDWTSHVEWRKFSFTNAFEQGWATFKANYRLALVAFLAPGAILIVVSIIMQFVQAGLLGLSGANMGAAPAPGQTTNVAGMLVASLVSMVISLAVAVLVQWPCYASLAYGTVATFRSEPASAKNLIRGFFRYPRAILVMLWITLIMLAVVMPLALIMGCAGAFAAQGGGGGIGAGVGFIIFMVFLMIILLYIMIRVYPGVILAMDENVRDLSTIGCIKTSWSLTQASSWEFFALAVVIYIMNIAGALLLLLPLIFFTGPLTMAIIGAMYHQLGFDGGLFKPKTVCRNCGYALSPGMAVCPECGHNTPSAAAAGGPFNVPPNTPSNTPYTPPQNPFERKPLPPEDPFAPRDPQDPYAPRQ